MFRRFFSNLSTWQRWLLGSLILFAIFLLTRNSKKGATVQIPENVPKDLLSALRLNLLQFGYDPDNMAPYIIALSSMESGRWTSPLYTRFNNPWGMRNPEKRETSSIGSTLSVYGVPAGFAIYFSDAYAARDFVYYLNEFNSPKKFATFYDFISWIQSKGYEPLLSTNEYFNRCLNSVA